MKRYGNLYARICDKGNLRLAADNASRGKHKRDEVTAFFERLEENLEQLHSELKEKIFNPAFPAIHHNVIRKSQVGDITFRIFVIHP